MFTNHCYRRLAKETSPTSNNESILTAYTVHLPYIICWFVFAEEFQMEVGHFCPCVNAMYGGKLFYLWIWLDHSAQSAQIHRGRVLAVR